MQLPDRARKLANVHELSRAQVLHIGPRNMRGYLASFVFASLVTGGCTESELPGEDGAADINGDEEKADGAQGIEVTVLMFVGDNIQDFPLLAQDVRKQVDEAFAKFGDSFFVLPNPMYGSWEKNLD